VRLRRQYRLIDAFEFIADPLRLDGGGHARGRFHESHTSGRRCIRGTRRSGSLIGGLEPFPDQACDPNQGGAQTAAQWFNTSCFTLQAQFTFGNAPRNSVLSPGYADVDMSVQKDVPLAGGRHLQFRWEVFNLLNRVNFDVPNRIAFTPNFGRVF